MLRQGDLRSLGTGWSHPAVKQPVEQSSPPGEEEGRQLVAMQRLLLPQPRHPWGQVPGTQPGRLLKPAGRLHSLQNLGLKEWLPAGPPVRCLLTLWLL